MSNYHEINQHLEKHQLPMTGVRVNLADAVKQYRTAWASNLISQHDNEIGTIRIGLEGAPGGYASREWAGPTSCAIGEIGWAGGEPNSEQVVWRTAFGYGQERQPDINQPWRAAADGRQAVGLLLEAFMRNVSDECLGRYYAACTLQSLTVDKRRRPEAGLRRIALDVQLCLKHPNSVRRFVDEKRMYLDPETGQFMPGYRLRHAQRWNAQMYFTQTNGSGTQAFYWYAGDWSVSCIRNKAYCVFTDREAGEWAIAFGNRIPAYVREMLELTQGQTMWFPSKTQQPSSWNIAVDNYLLGNRNFGCMKRVDPPQRFHSRDNIILQHH